MHCVLVGCEQHVLTAGRRNVFQKLLVGRTDRVDVRARGILLAQLVVVILRNRVNHAPRDRALLRHRQDRLEVAIEKTSLEHIAIPDWTEAKSAHLLRHPPPPRKNSFFDCFHDGFTPYDKIL